MHSLSDLTLDTNVRQPHQSSATVGRIASIRSLALGLRSQGGASESEVKKVIAGVYRAGLDNLRAVIK